MYEHSLLGLGSITQFGWKRLSTALGSEKSHLYKMLPDVRLWKWWILKCCNCWKAALHDFTEGRPVCSWGKATGGNSEKICDFKRRNWALKQRQLQLQRQKEHREARGYTCISCHHHFMREEEVGLQLWCAFICCLVHLQQRHPDVSAVITAWW